jgi:hypothetical protein
MRNPVIAPFMRTILAFTALLAAMTVHAQTQSTGLNLNVMAVNSNNGAIYSVTFAPPAGSTAVGNTDGSSYLLPAALAFVTNASTNQLDLLVADSVLGAIYRYPGALAQQTPPNPTTRTLVWSSWNSGTGPLVPDALAVDGYGNLFVGNSLSLVSGAQLWEFPVGTSGSGSFAAPVLVDKSFQLLETVLEVTFAPADVAGASGVAGGDLIVLTSQRVLAYSKASNYTSRITLLSFPNGFAVPAGMDFWPGGNGAGANYSLLIGNLLTGTISQYYFTSPLSAAPAPFATGLGELFRIKTIQTGNPLVVASGQGKILELGANSSGTGSLLATVTQNVTVPLGLAVSTSFTSAANTCLQSGGCDLTGLLTHTISGVSTLSGNIVENVCTVNADPRVSISSSGVWSCNVPYTPPASLNFTCPAGTPANGPGCLPVNAVCPGFDDTGKMAIPDSVCGRSGSTGSGFSLIKTLVTANQFAGAYVQNSAVLANGSNPLCGPGAGADGAFLWAPLQAEGTVLESPNMVEVTSGCGSIHGGSAGVSVWAVGMSVNEAAPELTAGGLPRPLENFAQTKYTDLTTTIDNLTQVNSTYPQWTDQYPNIAASVSLALWGNNLPPNNTATPFGCLDQSWLDFYNATQVDADGSAQWTADLQNAANLLTSADATGGTTCDGIVTYAQANNPATAFVQTPNATYPSAPTQLNPYGQLRSRLANLYYSINTRILGNAASATWPLPVAVNVVPTAVTLASTSSTGSAALSWSTNGATGCTLSSSDNYYQGVALSSPQTLTIPAADAGTIVAYTVSCTGGSGATSVVAYVTVSPPPTISVSPSSALAGTNTATTLSWNTNHAQGCTGSSNDASANTAFNNKSLSGTGSASVNPSAPGNYTYTLTCTSPSTTASTTLTVLAPPTLTFAGGVAAMTALQGSGTTLYWNQNGNSNCTLNGTDGLSSSLSQSPASGTTTVNTTVNPSATGPVTYTYTLACTGPPATPAQLITLTVVPQPTLQISTSSVIQGSSAALSWNTYGNSPCSLTSSPVDSSLTVATPVPATGSATVTPASPGSFTYTLTCPSPAAPVSAALTVTAPQAPLIGVSQSSIVQGNSATLSWTLYSGDVCTASTTDPNDQFSGPLAIGAGSMTVKPSSPGTYTYTLACTVPAATKSVTLTVTPQLARCGISASGPPEGGAGSGTLSWSLSGGPSGCQVSGSFPSHSAPQFSTFPVSASGSKQLTFSGSGTYTYTLSCTNPSSPVSTSVVITSK